MPNDDDPLTGERRVTQTKDSRGSPGGIIAQAISEYAAVAASKGTRRMGTRSWSPAIALYAHYDAARAVRSTIALHTGYSLTRSPHAHLAI
jgi:hypothetical protein